MTDGEGYIKRNLVRPDETPMPKQLDQKLYDALPPDLKGLGAFNIMEWAYNCFVEAYQKVREE